MKEDITRQIPLEKGVNATIVNSVLTLKGPKGEVSRDLRHPRVAVRVESAMIVVSAVKGTKREKTVVGSFESHVANMVKGVVEPFVYKLKICSGHFPMNVAVVGQEFVVKNFLGEAVPRRANLVKGATVKIEGTEITVTSCDKELAGLMAGRIEQLCRITNRDRRIFQDGCYMTEKAGKSA
ncbi:50S ribosomal protein L6 [Candidatus Woesearchaeota archaeon]|nr:50S ribosomal protein L6 [Candidatus Woesearchaeota archaeon]